VKGKKRKGRPLKTGKPLTKRVELRMSEAEYRKLEQKAKAKGLTVSEFLRQCGED
jgi:predicted DNA binding CopG/RHH family protein